MIVYIIHKVSWKDHGFKVSWRSWVQIPFKAAQLFSLNASYAFDYMYLFSAVSVLQCVPCPLATHSCLQLWLGKLLTVSIIVCDFKCTCMHNSQSPTILCNAPGCGSPVWTPTLSRVTGHSTSPYQLT